MLDTQLFLRAESLSQREQLVGYIFIYLFTYLFIYFIYLFKSSLNSAFHW